MTKEEITLLSDKIISGVATIEEIELFNRVFNSFNQKAEDWNGDLLGNKENIERLMHSYIMQKTENVPVVTLWKKWAVAAAALLIISTISFYIYDNKVSESSISSTGKENSIQNIIVPGTNKAYLTLGNGSTIILDTVASGKFAKDGSTTITKLDNGTLVYDLRNTNSSEITYNTITTPRGGNYQVILQDGSKVWLHAASSLRYPTAFNSNERKVQLKGEGYFEIAHNPSSPFKVEVNKVEVKVLGTQFNINAYNDENAIKTTLLKGSVRIASNNHNVLLAPGQQAEINKNGDLTVLKNIDVQQAIAWKNGLFHFESNDAGTIMRQISRWYDVDVVFEGNLSKETFSGMVSTDQNISEVLKILEEAGLKFRIEGKKLFVLK